MRRIMPKDDYELFTLIARCSQTTLQKMLYKILKRHYDNIINTQDYILAKGDIPIALVAHMDTVFKLPPQKIYYDKVEAVMWSPDGLGADDRAGVFLIVKILQNVSNNHKPTIIFTTDEESGCVGSYQLTLDYMTAPWDLKYIIQLDRKGRNDCVFYEDANKEIEKYVHNFGFDTSWGTLSDISILCPVWGISGVNLSVGYQDEHQEIETLHTDWMYETLYKVLNMLADIDNADHYEYQGDQTFISWLYRNNYSKYWYKDDDDDEDYYSWETTPYGSTTVKCEKCGKLINSAFAIKAKDEYDLSHHFCGDCAAEIVSWCEECGKAFITKSPWEHLCPKCLESTWNREEKNPTTWNKGEKNSNGTTV